MNKTKIWLLISFLSISPLALSEVINLTCFNEGQVHKEQKDWPVGKNRLIKFNLGESSKLAKMSAKGYPLIEFDLKVTDTYFLIGQYKSHLKVDLIPIFIINKSTLIVETDSFFSQQNLPKEPRKCLIEE